MNILLSVNYLHTLFSIHFDKLWIIERKVFTLLEKLIKLSANK